MQLDRKFQRKVLSAAAGAYPHSVHYEDFNELCDNYSEHFIAANLYYLQQHGLLEEGAIRISMDNHYSFSTPRCTHKGADFVADDGGLSAILGTVTVRLHEDTIRELIELRISQSDLPQKEKSEMISMIKKLPADSIKHLTMKLLEKGMEMAPAAAVGLINSFLK